MLTENNEELEMLDESGCFLGKGVTRAVAHSEGVMHGASHIHICKVMDGELYVLLQRRSLSKDSFPGCLDISSAGHIERGYDFISTAQKELREELGLETDRDDLIELFSQTVDWNWVFSGRAFNDREFNRIYLFNRSVEISDITIDTNELSEVLWMRADDVIAHLKEGDPTFGMNREEFIRSMAEIRRRNLVK